MSDVKYTDNVVPTARTAGMISPHAVWTLIKHYNEKNSVISGGDNDSASVVIARNSISEDVDGMDYAPSTGIFSHTSGYSGFATDVKKGEWDSAYTVSTTALVDADFGSNGLMKRTGVGAYSIIVDSSIAWGNAAAIVSIGASDWDTAASTVSAGASDWDTAYGWGDHASASYAEKLQIQTIAGVWTFNAIPAFNGGATSVSAPFTVDSTFKVTNLNAHYLDYAGAPLEADTASTVSTIAVRDSSGEITADDFIIG